MLNNVVLMGRLTKDPELRHTQSNIPVASFTIAVDRGYKKDEADFINIVAFGRAGEFAEKYFRKGTKVLVTGRIQTGSYTNKDGQKVYTTDVVAEDQEFAESKNSSGDGNYAGGDNGGYTRREAPVAADGDFMSIPEGIVEELPFT